MESVVSFHGIRQFDFVGLRADDFDDFVGTSISDVELLRRSLSCEVASAHIDLVTNSEC
jgi:hypothetical protein